jgi:hypothetical protein
MASSQRKGSLNDGEGLLQHRVRAVLRVTPVVDGNKAFVEWWATFDCEPERRDEFSATLRGWFGTWLESLRGALKHPLQAATTRDSPPFP